MKKLLFILMLLITGLITAAPAPPPGGNMGGGSWNDCGPGVFYDSGGSGANYTNNELITETYCAPTAPTDCIQFTFTSFDVEAGWDWLQIYDGPNTTFPLIGTYDGTTLPNGGTITSSSGCLTMVFDSDGSITRSGWEATYQCVPCPIPTCTDGIQNQGETGIDCGGPCPACPPILIPTACINQSYTLTAGQSIVFYDDGGPGGDPCADQVGGGNYCNCNCFTRVQICAAPGEYIIADFREFAMWNTTSGWDWMKIYDGPNLISPILYNNEAGGPDNPMGDCGIGLNILNFCSTGNCLTFEFWATSVVNRAGWDCLVTSVAIPCVLPVEFLEFEVYCDKFIWSTATETNNNYFSLYHSYNGIEWTHYKDYSGNGTINTPSLYEFYEENIPHGYYRLTQTDFDGKTEELSTKFINCTNYVPLEIKSVWSIDGKYLGTEYPNKSGLYIIKYKDGSIYKRGIIKY